MNRGWLKTLAKVAASLVLALTLAAAPSGCANKNCGPCDKKNCAAGCAKPCCKKCPAGCDKPCCKKDAAAKPAEAKPAEKKP